MGVGDRRRLPSTFLRLGYIAGARCFRSRRDRAYFVLMSDSYAMSITEDHRSFLDHRGDHTSSEAQFHTKHRHALRSWITFTLIPGTYGLEILELGRSIPQAGPRMNWTRTWNGRWMPSQEGCASFRQATSVGSRVAIFLLALQYSIAMVGEDSILRKFTFREPRSDS
jgi:hypothetical protein